MEKVNSESGEILWLLTDRELKTLFVATGCITSNIFEGNYRKGLHISFEETEKLWNLIDDMLKEGKPDEASS